jgi:hypothetical protein
VTPRELLECLKTMTPAQRAELVAILPRAEPVTAGDRWMAYLRMGSAAVAEPAPTWRQRAPLL